MRSFVRVLVAFSLLCFAGQSLAQERPAGNLISLDVVFADVGGQSGGEQITAAKILEFEKQGKLDGLTRVQLSLIENVQSSAHFGEGAPVVTGRQEFGGGRGGSPTFSRQNLGTTITATSRVEGDRTILVEVTAEQSRLTPGKATDAAEAADGADPQRAVPQSVQQTTSRTTVRVANGKSVLVGGQQRTAGKESAHTYIVLTATIAERPKAVPEVRDAPPAAEAPKAVIKVFALSHARASDVVKALRPILEGQPVSLATDERTNSIIAQGVVEKLDTASALIQILDRAD